MRSLSGPMLVCVFAAGIAPVTAACDRPSATPAQSEPARVSASLGSPGADSTGVRPAASNGSAAAVPAPRCVRPMPDTPAPVAVSPSACPEAPDPGATLPTLEVVFVDAPGQPRVVAEHALTAEQQARGLMYRTQLEDGAGMLFTWQDERPRSFWMKNTCLPLDMLFIDAQGFIVNVLEQVPTLNERPRRSGCPARHVLEVPAGWVREHAVRPGQRVQIGT